MSNSKCNITIRQLLCHVFIFASFFHVFSNGFTWIHTPTAKTYAEIGKSVTLRWEFSLNVSANESHYNGELIFKNAVNQRTQLASRQAYGPKFRIKSVDKFGNFAVKGTTDVLLILSDVQATFDGSFCFEEDYDMDGHLTEVPPNCTELFTFAYPLVVTSPKGLLLNVTDHVLLYCNATGKPQPDIRWMKYDDPSTLLASSSWFTISVKDRSDRGLFMCIANNSFGTHNKTFFVEVQYKPEIHYISNEKIRREGTTAWLYCNASGNPIPNITWAKNGTMGEVLVRGQGNAFLELAKISRADTGGYFCIAKNLLGRTYNRTNLTVQYRPVETHITAKPGPEVILGKTLVLSCTSSALPEVNQYKFFHNGTFFKNVTDGVLRISNITSSEGGEYECVPSNTLGKGDPARLKINVLVPPELYESLPNNSITINESDTLELRCKAKGNPLPVITWTKDSKFILQSNTYTKENASRYDAGVYRCTANNTIVKPVYSETTVIVNYAPEITFITTDAIVNETDDVSLYCNASGHPNPRLQWFKGNASIGTESIGNASKTLMNVNWKQGGNYVCQAKNFLGTKFATTKLDVQYKPINTKLTTNTGKHEVAIHETLVLNCSAQAFPPANLFIFSTTKNSTLQESPISTYTISREIWSPAEQYTCLPKNILGEGLPDSVNISFLEQPSFRYEPENKSLTVNETGNIELKCLVRGKPKPNVTWTKDGTSKIIGIDEVFTKNNANRSDKGTYRCRASNGVGRILEAVFSVDVNYKPINTRLISINGRNGVIVNESLTLNCSAESFPEERSYSFQVNGSTINRTSSNSTFTIKKDRPFNDENYTCIATNLLGSGKKSNILTITMFERPVIYSEPENVTVRENVTITLMCQARGKPWPTITWTKGDSMDTIETGETYSKAKAEKCDAGVYRCTADNGVKGSVSAQATVIVESYPEVPEIKSIAISIPRIEVHWKQPATNCSHPTTGYIAQVRKKESQKKWTQCEARYVKISDLWSCSFEDLESSKTYTLQIYAENRFGKGQPAEKDFVTKGDGARGSTDASKGELSTTDYITIGGSVGGFFLLIIIIVIVKRLKTNHGESSLETPIELREVEEVQIHASYKIEKQNCYEGPMTASQETLDVNETKEKEETLKVKVTEEKEAKDSAEDNKL